MVLFAPEMSAGTIHLWPTFPFQNTKTNLRSSPPENRWMAVWENRRSFLRAGRRNKQRTSSNELQEDQVEGYGKKLLTSLKNSMRSRKGYFEVSSVWYSCDGCLPKIHVSPVWTGGGDEYIKQCLSDETLPDLMVSITVTRDGEQGLSFFSCLFSLGSFGVIWSL